MKWDVIPEITLYSDGGADPNPGKGGFGVIMVYKGKRKEFAQGYTLTTNNRMELMGVIFGLERLKTKSVVNVFTDSRYVVDGITKGWAEKWKSKNWLRSKGKEAINKDLWSRLLDAISLQEKVNFNWVKGHAGHAENERCDELANQGINSNQPLLDIGYDPKVVDDEQHKPIGEFTPKKEKVKIEKEGDNCRKCGDAVVKKVRSKTKKAKPNQTYYFEYVLICPSCKTMYMTEDAKRTITPDNNLFY